MKFDFQHTGWARVVLGTICGTAFCVSAALFIDSFNFPKLNEEALRRAIVVDISLPTLLAGPLLFLLLAKVRQLAIAHQEMSIVASTDSLTAVLNRGAFTMLVDAYLKQTESDGLNRPGSLLVIDADHFKAINDRLGHHHGDLALKIIANTITSALRKSDLVGRIGGEEFGVFLPGADEGQAAEVAERIRILINEAIFPPSGKRSPLSVSVGGISFEQDASYEDLFCLADAQLYAAKAAGRNRIKIGKFGSTNDNGSRSMMH